MIYVNDIDIFYIYIYIYIYTIHGLNWIKKYNLYAYLCIYMNVYIYIHIVLRRHISKMYVLIERNNVHLRGSNIKRNLLSMKEADLGPNIREILLS